MGKRGRKIAKKGQRSKEAMLGVAGMGDCVFNLVGKNRRGLPEGVPDPGRCFPHKERPLSFRAKGDRESACLRTSSMEASLHFGGQRRNVIGRERKKGRGSAWD